MVPYRRHAARLALLALLALCAIPQPVMSREDVSVGECGDPGDGLAFISGGGNSTEVMPSAATLPAVDPVRGPSAAAPYVILIPVMLGPAVVFVIVVLPARHAGGIR